MIIIIIFFLGLVAYMYFQQYDLILDAIVCRYKCALKDHCVRPEEVVGPDLFYPNPVVEDNTSDLHEAPPVRHTRLLNKLSKHIGTNPQTSDQAGTSEEGNCTCTHYPCEKFEIIGRYLDPFGYSHFFDTFTNYFCHAIESVVTVRRHEDPSPLVYSEEVNLQAVAVESKDSQTNIVFDTPEKRKLYLKLSEKNKEADEKRNESQKKGAVDGSKRSVDTKEDKLILGSSIRRTSASSAGSKSMASAARRSSLSERDKLETKSAKQDTKKSENSKQKNKSSTENEKTNE